MIIQMIQEHAPAEHAQSYIEYSFFQGDNKIASFFAPNPPLLRLDTGLENAFTADYKGQKDIKIKVEKNNECPSGYTEKMLVYSFKEDDGTKKAISKYSYNYYEANSNQKIGALSYITICPPKKNLFDVFRSYEYQSLNYCGNIYDLYHVIAGKDGIFYCVHMNNELVAMVHKHNQVINFKDNYTIYANNNIDIDALCLIASHFDYANYEEAMPQDQYNVKNYAPVNTEFRKSVLEKYDPTFIQKIIDLENQ